MSAANNREREVALENLCRAYDAYNDLLIAELNDVVSIAYNHGWQSKRVQDGEVARAKLAEALKSAKLLYCTS